MHSNNIFTIASACNYEFLFYYVLDINECEDNSDSCDAANGVCTNTEGGYTCSCAAGYAGNGFGCTGTYIYLSHISSTFDEMLDIFYIWKMLFLERTTLKNSNDRDQHLLCIDIKIGSH